MDMTCYIGWSHIPRGGEIGVIESVEMSDSIVWLHVRLADNSVERRSFSPDCDRLVDERIFAVGP